MRKPKYKIGTVFINERYKNPKLETICDILTTTNAAGEVVRIEYKAMHLFAGQRVNRLVVETTIAMSKIIDEETEA